eukprot:GCRY01001137.1.p1 GENE.GCRY01001137.1~~GCRY01001137.1.p1  ORF type:complete len:470 (+),score=63.11 GCRY01001137.1:1047-2456(+)
MKSASNHRGSWRKRGAKNTYNSSRGETASKRGNYRRETRMFIFGNESRGTMFRNEMRFQPKIILQNTPDIIFAVTDKHPSKEDWSKNTMIPCSKKKGGFGTHIITGEEYPQCLKAEMQDILKKCDECEKERLILLHLECRLGYVVVDKGKGEGLNPEGVSFADMKDLLEQRRLFSFRDSFPHDVDVNQPGLEPVLKASCHYLSTRFISGKKVFKKGYDVDEDNNIMLKKSVESAEDQQDEIEKIFNYEVCEQHKVLMNADYVEGREYNEAHASLCAQGMATRDLPDCRLKVGLRSYTGKKSLPKKEAVDEMPKNETVDEILDNFMSTMKVFPERNSLEFDSDALPSDFQLDFLRLLRSKTYELMVNNHVLQVRISTVQQTEDIDIVEPKCRNGVTIPWMKTEVEISLPELSNFLKEIFINNYRVQSNGGEKELLSGHIDRIMELTATLFSCSRALAAILFNTNNNKTDK